MARILLLALMAAGVVAQSSTVDYSAMLAALFEQTDVDKDGALSFLEFTDAAAKLGVKPEVFTLHSQSYQTFFDAIDSDASGTVTQKELAGSIRPEWKAYQKPLIAAFTNGAGSVPSALPTPSAKISNAVAKVETQIVIAGEASEIYAGQREQIVAYFAGLGGVTSNEVVATFLTRKPNGGSAGRRLQTTAETDVNAKIYLASDDQAKALQGKIPTTAADMQQVPAFSGLTVTKTTTFYLPEWRVPFAQMAAMAAVLLVASFATCCAARCWARRNREIESVLYEGCCSTGCCSFFAVKSWAFWQLVASLILIVACAFLFIRMQGLTTVLVNLVDLLLTFASSTVSFVSRFQQQIPQGILSSLQQFKHLIPLLPIAVIVPGALAFVCLFFSGACPMGKCNPGGYCCTKTFIFFGNLLLILSLVFYSIFVGVSLVIRYAPPQIKTGLNRITGMCEVTAPLIKQTAADNTAALKQLEAAGQDVSQYTSALAGINSLVVTVDAGCVNILQMFVEFNELFLPGACCVVALCFGIYVNNLLCCSAGCCSSDQRKKQKEKDEEKGIQFSTVSATSNDAAYAAP